MRIWCATHQRNETLTGREVEVVFYAMDWLRADLVVDGSPGYRRGDANPEDIDQLDHLCCPREVLNDLDLEDLATRRDLDPTNTTPMGLSAIEDHVLDCYERRVAADRAARDAGELLR